MEGLDNLVHEPIEIWRGVISSSRVKRVYRQSDRRVVIVRSVDVRHV